MADTLTIPNFSQSGFYYFESAEDLRRYMRDNLPDLTEESDEEPATQFIRAWALAHHLANTRLDIVANEMLLPTSRLLASVDAQMDLIAFAIAQATPATTDLILKLSSLFTAAATLFVPETSAFATTETTEQESISFEALADQTLGRTDELDFLYSNKSLAITLSAKSGNLFDFVTTITPAIGDLIYQAGAYAIVTEVIDSDTLRVNNGGLLANGAATLLGSNFGSDKSGEANTDALTFQLQDTADPEVGDTFYMGNSSVMWNQVDVVVTQTHNTGIKGVWEYYDGGVEDANPDLVTNLGSTLEFDLTTLLGAVDRAGTKLTITYTQTSSSEEVVSKFSGGKNVAETTGLLGQVGPSTTVTDYLAGSQWAPLELTLDETDNFSQDGKITFELPQTITKNWQKTTINSQESFWLRFRVQDLITSAATMIGTGFAALGLDSSNYNIKVEMDGFGDTEVDVTGDAGVSPGTYTLSSVASAINAALTSTHASLSTTAVVEDGQIRMSGPDDALGKDSLIELKAPSGSDATFEVFGLSEAGYPHTFGGDGGTPTYDRLKMSEGDQFLLFPVTQGETVGENPLGISVGVLDQEFTLGFTPLIDGSLVLQVDEGSGFTEWTRVSNFLNSDQTSKHYVLDIDADDISKIKFGNGTRGKIPVDTATIKADYRIGADVNGNVGANTITVNTAGVSLVSNLYNPRAATGFKVKEGTTEESLAEIKIAGPASIRTQDRAITPEDYEFLAKRFISPTSGSSPVVRAKAIEETFGVKTIELVVVGPGGILLNETQRLEVDDYFNGNDSKNIEGKGLTNHEATTVNYTPRIIDVTATVEGGNKEAIENALTSLLNPEAKFSDNVTPRWNFEDEVPLSIIIAEIHETDPVNVKKVTLTLPAADITLGTRELPLIGTLLITVI